jgi:polysaccharide chain length determinant protein (PEP-CTERM system associated)
VLEENDNEVTFSLTDCFRILKKKWAMVLGIFLAIVIVTTIFSFLTPPSFQADTTLRIKQPHGISSSLLDQLPAGDVLQNKQLMSTYIEIIKSRTVIEKVIDSVFAKREEKPTYESMLDSIDAQPVKDTEVLKISVRGGTAREAQLTANTLVKVFIERITELSRAGQSQVRQFIGERLKASSIDLTQAEDALEAYKREQQIVAPEEETKAMVEQLSEIDKLDAANQVELVSQQAKLNMARQQLGKEQPGFVADNAIITQYKSKLADLQVQLVGLLEKYTEKHPEVIALKAQIDETKQKLNAEAAMVVKAESGSMNPVHQALLESEIQAEAQIFAVQAEKDAIAKIMNDKEKNLIQLPSKEQGLVRVTRNVKVAEQIYGMLAQRYEEAGITEVMQPTDVQIIDTAVAPEKPVKPNKRMNILIGAILGLFAGCGSALLWAVFHQTINDSKDVENYLDLPVIGKIPKYETTR